MSTERARAIAAAELADPERCLARVTAEKARRSGSRSFSAFVKQAWPIIDSSAFVWHWHLEALCLHLEAVARRQIKRFVGNMPPRNGKSNIFAILWPAWVWTWDPTFKFIYLSYSDDLVTEHSVKCRYVIESPWYRDIYKPKWRLAADQNTKHDFMNTAGGRRIASSIKAGVTGRGADAIAIDDSLSAEEAASKAERDRARRVIKQAIGSRFNDARNGVAAMVAQRLHIEDPCAWAIAQGWEAMVLPSEFDPARKSVTHRVYEVRNGHVEMVREKFWEDPRTEEGELLCPQRQPHEVLAELRKTLGPLGYAAQHGQSPLANAEAGKFFQRGWFKFLEQKPAARLVASRVRAWDFAATEKKASGNDPDFTVGLLLSRLVDGTFVIEDVVRGQWSPGDVRKTVKATADLDGEDVEISIPQDPAQAGKDQVHSYAILLAGYTVTFKTMSGDKAVRAGPASSQAQAGCIAMVRAPWNEPVLATLEAFPTPGVHDDDVDALAEGINKLALPAASAADVWADVAEELYGEGRWG